MIKVRVKSFECATPCLVIDLIQQHTRSVVKVEPLEILSRPRPLLYLDLVSKYKQCCQLVVQFNRDFFANRTFFAILLATLNIWHFFRHKKGLIWCLMSRTEHFLHSCKGWKATLLLWILPFLLWHEKRPKNVETNTVQVAPFLT